MLAAATAERDGALGMLRLVLRLEAMEQDYSDELSEYLMRVIQQSLDLAEDPARYTGDAPAEALSLALHIKSDENLRKALQSIITDGSKKSEPALDALKSLETRFDARCEPTHFSSGVYAAI